MHCVQIERLIMRTALVMQSARNEYELRILPRLVRLPLRRFTLSEEVDLEAVAKECAPIFTGADLYALCADGWMGALKRAMATVRT